MKKQGMGFLCAASLTLACTTGAGADSPAPGTRSHNNKVKATDSMMDTAGSAMTGACCFPSTACLDITEADCTGLGGEFRTGLSCVKPPLGAPGVYALRNHPDNHLTPPEYGLRLDELFDVNPAALDVFSFDFEADGAAMFLEYDGSSIHIFGTAFGGLDIGNDYDPAVSSLVEIDFIYSDVQTVPGDDDLYVVTPSGSDSGTVTWLDTNQVFNIVSQSAPEGFTFRFGNEDNDLGHRGFDGISGWGWVRLPNPTHIFVVQDWLFTAVGTCPDFPTGACCLENGTCVVATEVGCADQGGVYQGSGTTCSTVSCPQPGGACCLDDGFCLEATSEACKMAGGLFQGDFTACLTVECPLPFGACCLPTGLCVETTFTLCVAQGGNYQGDVTFCADVMCPQPQGACCLPKGVCVSATEANCVRAGGTYQGDFTACVNVTCPQPNGACCLISGACVEVTEELCFAQGGLYQGDMTLCTDVMCPQPPGACCFPDGGCLENTEENCVAQGGIFQGDFTSCSTTDCPQPDGACCLVDGSCVEVTEEDCAAQGGIFQGDFTACSTVDCPQPDGACCLVDGSCVEVTEEDCAAQGGEFSGDLTLCADVDCTQPGACCFEDGTCRQETVIGGEACEQDGGIYQGDDTTCDTVDCPAPTGGCCLTDGTCANGLTEADCAVEGGFYLGDDVPCSPEGLGLEGRYRLFNHPDGNVAAPFYGLRLDELFDLTSELDIFTFDFEHPDAAMYLEVIGSQIHIFGTAFGGLDIGEDYDPAHSSLIEVDFIYPIVGTAPGDDDLYVVDPGMGTIVWLDTNQTIPLFTKANGDGLFFRFGNEDDDQGHRFYFGLSGWGWLTFEPGTMFDGSQDWFFTARNICGEDAAGACCASDGSCVIRTQEECDAVGGTYQGDLTSCQTTDCTPVGACCLDDYGCVVTDEWNCVDVLHGDYQGDGSVCAVTNGLAGFYFENDDFTSFELFRIDASIAFDWGSGQGAPGVGPSDYSVRWLGDITAPSTGTYSFCASIDRDDAVKVWIDDVLIIDISDTNNSPTTGCGSIDLVAGAPVSIRVDYRDLEGNAKVSLTWATDGMPTENVPNSALSVSTCETFGACCVDNSECLLTTEWFCVDYLNGDYAGDNTTCDDVNCTPTGACCLDDGTCEATDEWTCEDVLGGVYQGNDIWCAEVNCPQPEGACCLWNGWCTVTTEWHCEDELNGDYQGNGTWCWQVDCDD